MKLKDIQERLKGLGGMLMTHTKQKKKKVLRKR